MPRPEVLDRIKEAEQEADDIVAEAEEDREQRIEEARAEAEEIRERAHEEADADAEERLEDAREEIEAEREQLIEEGEAARENLEAAAQAQVDEVVDHVIDLFEEAVHAQT
jgi:V/A-type H+-transporting ATPase subunit G/H